MLEKGMGLEDGMIWDDRMVEGDTNGVDDSPRGVEVGTTLEEMKSAGVLDGAIDEGLAEEVGVTSTVELMVLVEHTCVFSGPINLALSISRVPPSDQIRIATRCEVSVALKLPEMVFQ